MPQNPMRDGFQEVIRGVSNVKFFALQFLMIFVFLILSLDLACVWMLQSSEADSQLASGTKKKAG